MLTAIKTTGTANANYIVLDESLRTYRAESGVSVIVFLRMEMTIFLRLSG